MAAPDSSRRRLLYVAFFFPPTRASGVYRALATANHLAATGWEVTVLTTTREYFRDRVFSFDPSLEARVDARITVERVGFDDSRWEPDLRRWGWWRAHLPALAERRYDAKVRRRFPEPYAPFLEPALARAEDLHRASPYDVVLATGNPHTDFAVALELHERTGVPYAVDYRDSWTLDLFADAPAYPPGHPAWEWERRVLDAASVVTFVNEPLREWHAQRYPGDAAKMRVVANGWEPDVLTAAPVHAADPLRPLTFGYLGTLTTKVPLAEFVAGWELARGDAALAGATAHLHGHLGHSGAPSSTMRDLLPPEGSGLTYDGPVAKGDVGTVYAGLDVLLLILAGSRYVTSGKVFEYMATGRPIVSVHDPAAAATDVLTGYPLWFPCASLAQADIAAALVAAAAAARAVTPAQVEAARAHAAAWTRDAQLAVLNDTLGSLVRSGVAT